MQEEIEKKTLFFSDKFSLRGILIGLSGILVCDEKKVPIRWGIMPPNRGKMSDDWSEWLFTDQAARRFAANQQRIQRQFSGCQLTATSWDTFATRTLPTCLMNSSQSPLPRNEYFHRRAGSHFPPSYCFIMAGKGNPVGARTFRARVSKCCERLESV
jgi:hypothetical protein